MSSEYGTTLNSLLGKTLVEFKLRDVLKRYGIPGEETVRVDIESNDEIIACSYLPLNNDEGLVQAPVASLIKLREEIVEILNRGQDLFGLVEELEFYKPNSSLFKVHLNIGTAQVDDLKFSNLKIVAKFGYRSPCGPRECCAT